ncbi:MAG: ABC transporter ATP-binding protein [Lachnospiraceae bacterium]|nr:ABC transporter ATP-binding protein [Lachnospiraceae bacterium]
MKIQMEQVAVRYGKIYALKDATWELEGPALIGLLGKNGSGKTTLMRTLAGVVVPTSGRTFLEGECPVENLPLLKRIVYEEPNLARTERLKLTQVLDQYVLMYESFDRKFAEGILGVFGVGVNRRYGDLSQGMRSIFNFACALATRSELTLLDEPVSGMDVTVRKKVNEIILREYLEHPRVMIISSHMASEMEQIFSHVLLLDQGAVAFFGEMSEAEEQAYRVDGKAPEISAFCEGKRVLVRECGQLGDMAIVEEHLTKEAQEEAARLGVRLKKVSAIDYCFHKINRSDGKELDRLWER